MNADQMINHMMTVIYTTADVEGIQVTRHFRPQEIVDSTLAACYGIFSGKSLSERKTTVLIVTFGDTWRKYIRCARNTLISFHLELIARKRGM